MLPEYSWHADDIFQVCQEYTVSDLGYYLRIMSKTSGKYYTTATAAAAAATTTLRPLLSKNVNQFLLEVKNCSQNSKNIPRVVSAINAKNSLL